VRDKAASLPQDAWIVGGAVPTTLLPTLANTASRLRLDEAAGGRPVVLLEDSRHNRWANTRVLELAGITGDSIPASGVTTLDPDDGTPTGVLLEAADIPVQEAYDRSGGLTPAQHAAASRRASSCCAPSGSQRSRTPGSRSRSCRRWPTWIARTSSARGSSPPC
jgi:predicted amidohydrolase YtcJ